MKRAVSLVNRLNENIKLNAIKYLKLKLKIVTIYISICKEWLCRDIPLLVIYIRPVSNIQRVNQKYLAHRRRGVPLIKN